MNKKLFEEYKTCVARQRAVLTCLMVLSILLQIQAWFPPIPWHLHRTKISVADPDPAIYRIRALTLITLDVKFYILKINFFMFLGTGSISGNLKHTNIGTITMLCFGGSWIRIHQPEVPIREDMHIFQYVTFQNFLCFRGPSWNSWRSGSTHTTKS